MSFIVRNKSRIYLFLLILIFITLFWPKENINSMVMILLVVFWLLDRTKNLKQLIKSNYFKVVAALFLIYAAGLIYTTNPDKGILNLQRLIPLVLLPLIMGSMGKTGEGRLRVFKLAAVVATVLAAVYSHIHTYFQWVDLNKWTFYDFSALDFFTHYKFTFTHLTRGLDLHPIYFSWIILFVLLLIRELFLTTSKKRSRIALVFVALYLTFFLFHMASKSGILGFFVLLAYFTVKQIAYKNYKRGLLLLAAMVLSGFVLSRFDFVTERIKNFKTAYFEAKTDYKTNYRKQRIIALESFLEQPPVQLVFGQGTGGSQHYLDSRYEKYDRELLQQKDLEKPPWQIKGLNYHNQFLQTMGDIGILGGVLLVLLFITLFKRSRTLKSDTFTVFIILSLLFFGVESVLVRHKGIVFFSLVNAMLYYQYIKLFRLQSNKLKLHE